jgi:very-short-patch-repair endonuclease
MSQLDEILERQLSAALPGVAVVRQFRLSRQILGDGPGIQSRVKNSVYTHGVEIHDWAFDFSLPEHRILLEVQGGTWTGGRHSRGAGYQADCQKSNVATLYGWRVFRFTADDVKKGVALRFIEKTIKETRDE